MPSFQWLLGVVVCSELNVKRKFRKVCGILLKENQKQNLNAKRNRGLSLVHLAVALNGLLQDSCIAAARRSLRLRQTCENNCRLDFVHELSAYPANHGINMGHQSIGNRKTF